MISSLDTPGDYRDVDGKETKQRIYPTPFLQETKDYREVAPGDGCTAEIVDSPTFALPAINKDQYPTLAPSLRNVDQLPAQDNLKAVSEPAITPYFVMDDSALYEQPTWIIPVIPVTSKAPKTRAQDSGAEGYISIICNLLKARVSMLWPR